MKCFSRMLILATVIFGGGNAFAHHSAAATYNADTDIQVEGVVTEFSFRNPHILVYVDVTNADGSTTNWMSEGAAATLMRRSGWSRDTLQSGDLVRVNGSATHDGSPMVLIETIDVLDPEDRSVARILRRQRGGRGAADVPKESLPLKLADGRPHLSAAWTQNFAGPRRRPGSDDVPIPFNDAGTAAQAAYDSGNDPQIFCDPPGLIRQAGFTPHPVRITQKDDHVIFEYEEYGGRRVIMLGDLVAEPGVKTHLGDSVARYDGDSLIIETVNLLGNPISPAGNSMSNRTTTVEIYKRADHPQYGTSLSMETIVTDPGHLSEKWSVKRTKVYAAGYEFIENDCRQPLRTRETVSPAMNFFLTSAGPGDGANLGGLAGADGHCSALAESVGAGGKTWRAYLSTTGNNAVDARHRIGSGPFYNARGVALAANIAQLHEEDNGLIKATVLDQHGGIMNGRGDDPNRHDILTGSTVGGGASGSDADTTCSNWTGNDQGSALVGHFDRTGGGQNPTSWNSAHGSRGCSQADLRGTGGDGLFYCFAVE